MRSEWEALHQGLVQSIGTLEAERTFDTIRRTFEVPNRFESPEALVRQLASTGGDLDEKDRVLTALVLAARADDVARLATALLLLGLWPGLDAAFGRRVVFRRREPGEVAADLISCFTDQVRRMDPTRVRRVAATLVRNTERDVMRASVRESRLRARMTDVSIEEAEEMTADPSICAELRDTALTVASICPVSEGAPIDEKVAALRAWLRALIGAEANLVVEAVLLNRSRQDLAAELRIDQRAARKRLSRALRRIRRILEAQISRSRGDEGWRLPGHERETQEFALH
jgi:RNA polymerase sigma-70 factor (ECF subfamily)